MFEQREAYSQGKLSGDQIKRLDSIGMDWLSPKERAWENGFQKVEHYVKSNKCVTIPATYRNENGVCVGLWLRRQIKMKDKLTIEQVRRLQELGVAI